jgi:hypothetical protein
LKVVEERVGDQGLKIAMLHPQTLPRWDIPPFLLLCPQMDKGALLACFSSSEPSKSYPEIAEGCGGHQGK